MNYLRSFKRFGLLAALLLCTCVGAFATDPETFDVSTMTSAVSTAKDGASTILVGVAAVWGLFILAKLAKKASNKV